MALDLGEAMALAVLRGDRVAAYALADRLLEERASDPAARAMGQAATREAGRATGYHVYRWPEFEAFARRLGFMWDLLTVRATITLDADEPVTILQEYRGTDVRPATIDTTTFQNQRHRTAMPNPRPDPDL